MKPRQLHAGRTLVLAGLFMALASLKAPAQHLAVDSTLDHEVLIARLRNAKDLLYQQVLWRYDTHLGLHPSDVRAHVERCAFIGKALYDETDEYNPNEEAHDSCLTSLGEAFPDEPTVLLARAEARWGEDRTTLLQGAEAALTKEPHRWEPRTRASLYRNLAEAHYHNDDSQQAAHYMDLLLEHDPDQRGSMLHAGIMQEAGRDAEAIEALNMRQDTNAWELQQRAKKLLELGDHANALRLYHLVETMDSSVVDNGALARTLAAAGRYAEARAELVRDTSGFWRAANASLALFEHDLEHHGADTCLASYNAFRDHGFAQDPLALSRLQLLVRHPLLPWKARDLLGMGLLLILALFLVVLPYLWVLPVHFIGHRTRRFTGQVLGGMRWGLKHFWWVSAAYLLASLAALMVCPSCVREHFADNTWGNEVTSDMEGLSILVFILVCAVLTLLALSVTGLKVLGTHVWSIGRSIGQAVLYYFILRFCTGVYVRIVRAIGGPEAFDMASMGTVPAISNGEITAFHSTYGGGMTYLTLTLLVPIYEEVLFRGVILNSTMRYLGFGWANVLQSLLFTVVHGELVMAPFFFAFGLITGTLAKRSGSLLSGILFHVLNNLVAITWILARQI